MDMIDDIQLPEGANVTESREYKDAKEQQRVKMVSTTLELGLNLVMGYKNLLNATSILHGHTELESIARGNYERAKAALLLAHADNPTDLGKNEAAREATIKVKLWEQGEVLEDSVRRTAQSRHEFNIAQLAVDSLRAQLRCFEVIAALGKAE